MDEKIKIITVDDHEIVRDGISILVKNSPNIIMIGEACDATELFELLRNNITPDIIVLDIQLPEISGIEIVKKLAKEYPKIKVIMFSGSFEEHVIFEALEAGALGFVTKNSIREELREAIESVHQNKPYLSSYIPNDTLVKYIRKEKTENKYAFSDDKKLSVREAEILKLLASGFTFKEIASKLFISSRTVESHKKNIEEKLDLHNIADLIKYAIKNKITEM